MWEVVARSVGDLEGVLGFEVGITDVLPRVISTEKNATDDERAA